MICAEKGKTGANWYISSPKVNCLCRHGADRMVFRQARFIYISKSREGLASVSGKELALKHPESHEIVKINLGDTVCDYVNPSPSPSLSPNVAVTV